MAVPPPIRYDLVARGLPEGPIDLPGLIPGAGELELEIGFGRGRFLVERAAAAPTSRLVGIEIKAKLAHQVEQRRVRDGFGNVVALWGDARLALARAGPDGSVQRVFIHFPDPWWKKRHAKRAVVDDRFIEHLARLIALGGELFVQTDVLERFEPMRDLIAASTRFEIATRNDNPYGARSNREVRAEEDGLPVYRIHARRR